MKQIIYGFLLALQFLTRIPVNIECPWNSQTSKWALRSYPIVGLLLGSIIMALFFTLESYLSVTMMTLLIISLWVWITGGLHLDGWMDVADAVGSNVPLEKKWEIMKDPHVGSFGHIALLFLLAWKTVLIYQLAQLDNFIIAFLCIIMFSRLGAVVLMVFLPTAKKQGLAWEWKRNINRIDCIIAIIPVLVFVFFFHELIFFIPAYIVFFYLFGAWVMHTFKGTNGDLLGTAIEGGELWGLVIAWISFSFVMV